MLFDPIYDQPKPPENMTHRYTDGSNNIFFISPQRIVYVPITPMQSSSGTYSGRPPATVEIALDTYEIIIQYFAQAKANKDIQMTTRPKGCGTLFFAHNKQQITIGMNSIEKQQLEKLLKNIIA